MNASVVEAGQLLLMNEAGQCERVRSDRDGAKWETPVSPRGRRC